MLSIGVILLSGKNNWGFPFDILGEMYQTILKEKELLEKTQWQGEGLESSLESLNTVLILTKVQQHKDLEKNASFVLFFFFFLPLKCGVPFQEEDVIILNGNKEDVEVLKKRMEDRRLKSKLEKVTFLYIV